MNFNGYESITTFWQDFSIADMFGTSAIKETFEDCKGWICDYKFFTELVMVLNWKSWAWYEKNDDYCKVYTELFYKAQDMAYKNFKGEELKYYIRTTD